ncbi:MAG TPA: tetratricopeptide repeat protein [Archangium sp.]|uniref:CHAT domain-containing tetratricopeptide repeat protein n=1 Tax=Archangium sp. TaxID=1872627 RepID=UPI002EDB7CFB
MQRVRGWLMVVVLCCAAGAAGAQEQPDARLHEARTAFDEAHTFWDAGRYADAIARGERALALREAVLGDTHPDVARSLDQLGAHLLLQGNAARAEPLFQRSLAIWEAALGENHPETARTLNTLGKLYTGQALYVRAEPLLQRALAIREAALGERHPLVAESLNHLANLYTAQRVYARAEPLFVRALALREAALGEEHPEVAQTLQDLAWLYDLQGMRDRARPLLQRALAIREATLGKDHSSVADSLHHLASIYGSQGLYARAEPLLQRELAIRQAALGKNPPDVAASLERLAWLYMDQGLFTRAEPLYLRAVALREATLGENHLLVAETLGWLGYFYFEHGVYGRAEPLLERAVAIREVALGENHPLVADLLLDLGNLYVAQGLYARAEPILQRAWVIRKTAFGENSRFVATALLDLGNLYVAQGLYARAEPLLRRGLAIQEEALGENHNFVARTLSRLGDFYVAQGLYTRAEPLLTRALSIAEAAAGRNSGIVAATLKSLADLYVAQGLYGRARPLYERALAIWGISLGEHHPNIVETLNHLGVVHLAQGRRAKALPLLTRAFTLSERRLRQESLGFSEVRLASFLQYLRADEERLYALLRAHPDDVKVRRLALGAALLLKGRSVEESADISRTVYQSLGERDRDTFERLRELRTRLAELSFQGPGSLLPAAHQRRLEEFAEQGAALEADLAKRSTPLRALTALPPPSEIVDRVAAALPRDAALVEFITYEDRALLPRPGTPESQRPGTLRYLALVLLPDATIRFQDLGAAEPIDSAASRLRDALANRDAGFEASAQALHQLAFQPLLPLLGDTRRLFLSPDGQLALVPFAALHDGKQFLVDAFDFTYVPSGKSLLPRPEESAPPGSVVVLADPDFRAPLQVASLSKEDAPAEDAPALATRTMPGERFFSLLRADLGQRAWDATPLPGTRQEAEAIQRLLPQAQLFLGPEATKERLLQLPPPGILHLATHGFFLEDASQPRGSRAVGHFGALGEDTQAPSPPDPLLRSGLVLAGASALVPSGSAPPPSGNALVTALEVAGLNLWGTQLVVLSACDTGRGDVRIGQGVYGLRRAFLVAGAETVVMSLWKVNDETTRELMEVYYRNLLEGQGRATALREAMRELRRTQPHPHHWAPFLAMGQETPLRLPESCPPRSACPMPDRH